MGFEEGTVLNKEQVYDRIETDVAASTSLVPGLCYIDGSNGVKQCPTDGSVVANRVYWCEDTIASQTNKGDKTITIWGEGAVVIGKADGVITVGERVKPSTNHVGNFEDADTPGAVSGASPSSAEVDAYRTFIDAVVGVYLGHVDELTETGDDPTSAADTDTDAVFLIKRI